jgi:hypothetical protein
VTRETEIANNDVASAFDALRQLMLRADAMVCATERLLEDEDGGDGRRREHLAHLLGVAKEAVRAAVYVGGQIATELAKHRDGQATNRAQSGDVAPASSCSARSHLLGAISKAATAAVAMAERFRAFVAAQPRAESR